MDMFPYVVPSDDATAFVLPVTLLKNGHQLGHPRPMLLMYALFENGRGLGPTMQSHSIGFEMACVARQRVPLVVGRNSTSARVRCRVKSNGIVASNMGWFNNPPGDRGRETVRNRPDRW
jgi:hypothetical protein